MDLHRNAERGGGLMMGKEHNVYVADDGKTSILYKSTHW